MMQILIVEDEIKLAAFVQQALQEKGYDAVVLSDGNEGLQAALTLPYDLLILDWLLPSCSGLDLCRKIRAKGKEIPILMLTARDAMEDKILGLDSGADDYLTKPFALAELLARVRALLRRKSLPNTDTIRIGDLTLIPLTRQVYRGEYEVYLTTREYSLLEYLMRNKEKAVSRLSLLEHVWGYDFDVGTNVVDVYINYLRKKLDREGAQKLIRSVRGVGYQLAPCPVDDIQRP
jgi:DNA-binding response OmpR family regulator